MNSPRRQAWALGHFERATGVCPFLAADRIVDEAEDYFRARLPRRMADDIARRAERLLAANDFWRRKFTGHRGRAYLTGFLRHRLASALAKEKPALFRRLPDGFKIGEPLPHFRLARRFEQ